MEARVQSRAGQWAEKEASDRVMSQNRLQRVRRRRAIGADLERDVKFGLCSHPCILI